MGKVKKTKKLKIRRDKKEEENKRVLYCDLATLNVWFCSLIPGWANDSWANNSWANDSCAGMCNFWECLISLTVAFKLVSSQSEVSRQTKNDKSWENSNPYKFTQERHKTQISGSNSFKFYFICPQVKLDLFFTPCWIFQFGEVAQCDKILKF